MVYTKENIVEGIYAKIDAMNELDVDDKAFWKDRLMEYPVEIEQNILEWVNDYPITEVDCRGESVLRTMWAFDLDESWMPFIVDGFIKFKNSNFRVQSIIGQSIQMRSDRQ